MKISQYMQYLKILQDRYGDIDVKTETRYETMGENAVFKNTAGQIW